MYYVWLRDTRMVQLSMFQTRMNKLLKVLAITLLWVTCASSQTAAAQQRTDNTYSDTKNLLIGKWYHKTESTSENITMMAQYVQDFLPNGTISEQAQYVTTTRDGLKMSCLANTSWEWSESGNQIYQKIIASHVIPDFIRDRSGKPFDDPELLKQVCDVVKKDKSERQLTTSVFTIVKLDNKVNVYQYQDSKGAIKESTDYRVNQGLAQYKVK